MTTCYRSGCVRTFCVLLLAMLSACAGFDPRRFDDVRYGMAKPEVVAALDSQGEPLLRLMPRAAAGSIGSDVLVFEHDAMHPHPTYYTVFVDGALRSVLTRGRAEQCQAVEPQFVRTDVAELVASLRERRMPLTWSEREPIDALEQSKRMNPTTVTILTIAAMPPVWVVIPLLPVVIPLTIWLEGDGPERRTAMQAALLALPRDADRAAVVAAIGAPQEKAAHPDDREVELWSYWADDVRIGFRVAFARGKVLWIDFSYYTDPG